MESEWGKAEYSKLGLHPFDSINGIEDSSHSSDNRLKNTERYFVMQQLSEHRILTARTSFFQRHRGII